MKPKFASVSLGVEPPRPAVQAQSNHAVFGIPHVHSSEVPN